MRYSEPSWVAVVLLLGVSPTLAVAQEKPAAGEVPSTAAAPPAAPAAKPPAEKPAAEKAPAGKAPVGAAAGQPQSPSGQAPAEPAASAGPDSGVAYATPSEPAPAVGWASPQDATVAGAPVAEGSATQGVPAGYSEPPPPPMVHRDPLSLIAIYYSTAAAVSDTRDFAGGFSWGGFTFDGRQRVYDRLAVGLSLAWQNFHYKSYRTSTIGNITVTGVQSRQQTVFPMLATAHYSFSDDVHQPVLPFVGLGAGAYAVNRLLDIGPAARFTDNSWHFGFAPEVGVALPGRAGALMVACKFHYAFEMDDAPKQTYFNFSVGGAFDD